jgi:hypothetical protein
LLRKENTAGKRMEGWGGAEVSGKVLITFEQTEGELKEVRVGALQIPREGHSWQREQPV